MRLDKDLREFLALLNSKEVEYLVVGAFAVSYYGFPRYTADLDLFINPTPENAGRVLSVLADFGFGSLGITAADLQADEQVIQLGVSPNRVDLLTSLSAVEFAEAWREKSMAKLDGVPTQFIGIEQLIKNKEATGRARDMGDAEELKKRRRSQ